MASGIELWWLSKFVNQEKLLSINDYKRSTPYAIYINLNVGDAHPGVPQLIETIYPAWNSATSGRPGGRPLQNNTSLSIMVSQTASGLLAKPF